MESEGTPCGLSAPIKDTNGDCNYANWADSELPIDHFALLKELLRFAELGPDEQHVR